jgi:hypothetical protein
MDRIAHVDAPFLEQVCELAHRVLRLRDGQAVARDDYDPVGVGEHRGDIRHRRLAH